ncbi:MAG: hypothetical protein C0403_00450 [Desulfobacterium sp.]|nr:hypothetical protein [Desulfobacterium sp.]
MRKLIKQIFCVFWVLCFILSCGYNFAGMGKIPGGVKTICVTMLKNNTNETGLERIITNSIVNEFSRNGVPMTKDPARADGILSGSVASVYTTTIARSSANTSSERSVYIKLDMKLMNSKGKLLWTRSGIEDNEAYQAGLNEDRQKKKAINDLVKRLSRTFYQRLTDDF